MGRTLRRVATPGWRFRYWWDHNILPGEQFDDAIQSAMDGTCCAVVVWSKASVVSRWVKTEAREAARRNILVPVAIEGVTPPLEFRSFETADLSERRSEPDHENFRELTEALRAAIAKNAGWNNSVIKFTSQEEVADGLALRGTFSWRLDNALVGTEEFTGHYVIATRQIFLERTSIRDVPHSGPARLAMGSYSAVVSADERALVGGRWGQSAQSEPGVLGRWEATR